MAADAEATLPSLIEAVKRLMTDDRKRAFEDRGRKLAHGARAGDGAVARRGGLRLGREPHQHRATIGGNWAQIKNEDWSLVSEVGFVSDWPLQAVELRQALPVHRRTGRRGRRLRRARGRGRRAGQQEIRPPLGEHSERRRPDVRAGGFVDRGASPQFRCSRSMHNNRAYHQEVMHVQRMANRHNRDVTRAGIGTTLHGSVHRLRKSRARAGLARRRARSPIRRIWARRIRRAIEVVKRGEPALVDVITQPR